MQWITNRQCKTPPHDPTPSRARRPWFTPLVGVAVVAVLGLPAGAGAQTVVDEQVLGTNGAAVPVLEWAACPPDLAPAGYECTTAAVPLSYRDPAGPAIELALGRLPAGDPARRIGTLFWNPGGPGGPGRIPPAFTEELHERFDIVGFDPRGIAASTQLRCFENNEQAFTYFGWEFPITLTQTRRAIDLTRQGTTRCARNGGPIISHMATANVARDIDLLRQAVGDEQLTYVGFSYGTHIGTVYANLFPSRVRALTLDAVIEPVEWTTGRNALEARQPVEYRAGSFHGAYKALRTFLADCTADSRCAFRERGSDLRAKFDTLLTRLKHRPVPVVDPEGNTFLVTYQLAVGFTLGSLYSEFNAPFFAEELQRLWLATEAGNQLVPQRVSSHLARASVRPSRGVRTPEDEPYFGIEAGPAVQCTDSDNPSSPWLWPLYAHKADREAPYFGSIWVYFSLPCATWPATDVDRYTGPWNRRTANPLLLVGNSEGDPATPYEDAVSTTRRLADARLLTYQAWGHAAFLGASRCIDAAVERYLIAKQLPPRGKVCRPDRLPFDPLPEGAASRPAELVPSPQVAAPAR